MLIIDNNHCKIGLSSLSCLFGSLLFADDDEDKKKDDDDDHQQLTQAEIDELIKKVGE